MVSYKQSYFKDVEQISGKMDYLLAQGHKAN